MAILIDPLKQILEKLTIPDFKKEDTALLVVDMQYYDAYPDYGLVKICKEAGIDVTYYEDRLRLITGNIKKLLGACREKGLNVIYCTIESLTPDGRDRSTMHKATGLNAQPGSKDAAIIEEIKPQEGEILLRKTCSGVFNGTNIDQILHNMHIDNLIVVGVVTNQCVDTAVRDAADRGYVVTLVEDACAAFHPSLHEGTLDILGDVYCRVCATEEAITNIVSANKG